MKKLKSYQANKRAQCHWAYTPHHLLRKSRSKYLIISHPIGLFNSRKSRRSNYHATSQGELANRPSSLMKFKVLELKLALIMHLLKHGSLSNLLGRKNQNLRSRSRKHQRVAKSYALQKYSLFRLGNSSEKRSEKWTMTVSSLKMSRTSKRASR